MHSPEQRQKKQYITQNACSKRPSFFCVMTLILYLGIIVLHIVYICTPIVSGKVTSNPILYILLALHFFILALILYDYIWLLTHDPVDRVVYDPQLRFGLQQSQLQVCTQCGPRLKRSYHCSTCQHCTEQFDHHCKFLNNCIGGKNYQKFLRILITNIIFHIILIGQGVWLFLAALKDQNIRNLIPKSYWVIVGIVAVSAVLIVTIAVLMCFHCYLSCCKGYTTLQYLFPGYFQSNSKNQRKGTYTIQTQRQIY